MEPGKRSVGRACLLVLAPVFVVWLLAYALEEGVGFDPAQAQATTIPPGGSLPPTITGIPPSTNPRRTTTTEWNPPLPTESTQTPPTTKVPRGTLVPPRTTGVPGTTNGFGARWVCKSGSQPGVTVCVDP